MRDVVLHGPSLKKYTELRFILDESIEYGIEMSKKIDALTGGTK